MRLLSTLILAFFAVSFSLQAQTTDKVYEKAKEKTEKLAKVIELNDQEKERMTRINYEVINNTDRLQKMEASSEEKTKMTEAYEKRMNEQVKELLGEERYATYLEASEGTRAKAKTRANK